MYGLLANTVAFGFQKCFLWVALDLGLGFAVWWVPVGPSASPLPHRLKTWEWQGEINVLSRRRGYGDDWNVRASSGPGWFQEVLGSRSLLLSSRVFLLLHVQTLHELAFNFIIREGKFKCLPRLGMLSNFLPRTAVKISPICRVAVWEAAGSRCNFCQDSWVCGVPRHMSRWLMVGLPWQYS